MHRRSFSAALAYMALGSSALLPKNSFASSRQTQITAALQKLEAQAQGRLGVHLLDTASGQEYGYRSDERFMMLSSFKLLASALVLARADRGQESLERRIRYGRQDLVPWSPVTEAHVDGEGLTLAQLCHATITTSDNTAANLILASYGGPQALTAFARQLGDTVTRLDRKEPELNVRKGILDTTSPRAMAKTLQTLLLGNALSSPSRQLLQQWMLANTTGGKRLKAGLPEGWGIGDKTGTNKTSANDIGILLPPQGAPMVVTAYLADSAVSSQRREDAIAEVARVVAGILR
ncbi:class A beta-lactamase [Rhodoferax saidenbachensis]|uniref:beta-lactamase n=2 Tax=Rhodoferax saidenbachensis TaxID=1484693 RepID=A0A1P8KAH8_9BURK|nr:class A beta-lactamase [Rhodoferax saidenbachensis]APW43006.1 class A beta-lactamase [Rhodoferax saidenbachensis]